MQKYMHKGLPSASPLPRFYDDDEEEVDNPAYDQRTQHDHPKTQKETTKLPTSLPVPLLALFLSTLLASPDLTPTAHSGCGLYSLVLLKEKLYAKIRRFQLRPPHTRHAVTAPLDPKMQQKNVYKTVYVTWCCYSLVVVNLGFPCLYFALSLGVFETASMEL